MRWKEIAMAVAIIGVIGFCLSFQARNPNFHPASNFGPEWQCTESGRGGPAFCIKKDLLNQTENKN
jgi:hypothetical protein